MIITLICIAAVIVGIICLFINERVYSDMFLEIGVALIVCGTLTSIICVSMIIGENVTQDIEYQKALYEKEILEYRIEHIEENVTGNEMLYNDIVEFNNKLRDVKKWVNSPWTNWFNNEDIASIEYIKINNN